MRFDPVSEQEATQGSSAPWPPGDYDFEVREASEETSAAGNEMIKLQLWVYDTAGNRRVVFDYLVSSAAWKIRQFATACGLLSQYERGALSAAELVGRPGRCSLRVAQDAGYEPQNKVRAYIKAAGQAASTVATRPSSRVKVPAGDDLSDSIPF